MISLPGLASAADPSPAADSTTEAQASSAPTPDPTATPDPTPTPDPGPVATQAPAQVAGSSLNLFRSNGFRYQDPNYVACTATAVRSMLNFVAVVGAGGEGFQWRRTNAAAVRDSILAWERRHDTLTGGRGSDPHGWRNALNFYGWGPTALVAGARVYEDASYSSFDGAMKATVRALASTRKPVGVVGWRGAHAQMITGYYGLVGDPFARDAAGRYTNAFKVSGFYLTDPLRRSKAVNRRISYTSLRSTMTYRLRFQRFYEKDSRLDDLYTPGFRISKTEWYKRFVLILPIR